MKILLKIAIVAVAAAFMAGCCNCRSIPEKDPPPAGGHRVAADPARRQGGQTRGGQIHRHAARRRQPPDGRRGLQPPDGRLQDRWETHAEDRASGRDDDGLPGMDEEEAFTKMLESVTHYDMDGPMLLLLSDGELRAVFQARP